MPSKSVSASMTTMPSTSGSTELTASSQHKKAQVIFLQRSPKLIISRNGSEAVQHFILTQQPIVNVSDFRSTLTEARGPPSSDTVIVDTSNGTTVDGFGQSGTTSSTSTSHHHHQPLGDEVTYVASSNNLTIPATAAATTTTLRPTTVAAATEVGFLTSEAEGTVETVVVRSSDISGSDESQQLSLMDAYPIGQVTSTY